EDRGRPPGRLAEDAHAPLARCQLAGRQAEERRLPRPVRPQEADDAGADVHGDVVQGDHGTVPPAHALEDEGSGLGHPTISSARTRRHSRARAAAAIATRAPSAALQCGAAGSRVPKNPSQRADQLLRTESRRRPGRTASGADTATAAKKTSRPTTSAP